MLIYWIVLIVLGLRAKASVLFAISKVLSFFVALPVYKTEKFLSFCPPTFSIDGNLSEVEMLGCLRAGLRFKIYISVPLATCSSTLVI